MIRTFIFFFCAATVPFTLVGQGNIAKFDLPVKVKRLMERICCNCDIHNVWMPMDYSFYNFEYALDGEQYHISIDSSGHWNRTYQEVCLDSIPEECLVVYQTQKSVYDAKSHASGDVRTNVLKDKVVEREFKMQRVLKEFDEMGREGYYDFVLQKEYGYAIYDEDTAIMMDMEHIKINFDCQLLNFDGKLVEYVNRGEFYGRYDGDTSVVFTIERSGGKKDGLSVQYHDYPENIKSVEYNVNGAVKGPFYSYYENGNLESIGYYQDGRVKYLDQWRSDGKRKLKDVRLDTLTNTFMSKKMEPLEGGKCLADNRDVYFTQGKIDSVVSDIGKFTGYHDNYVDSTRTLVFYGDSGFVNNIRIIRMRSFIQGIADFQGLSVLSDRIVFADETYEIEFYPKSKVVKEKGAYKNYKKVGAWYYYNENGRKVKTEHHGED